MDRLDYQDKHYDEKYNDMQKRIDSLYDEIADNENTLKEIEIKIQGIKEKQISQERIYEFLEMFDMYYDKFTEIEKKEFLHNFISSVEIYPEPLEDGQILKSVEFKFPVYYKGMEADMFIPKFEKTLESIVLLQKR